MSGLSKKVKKVADAMEELGFVGGFKIGDGVGLTLTAIRSLQEAKNPDVDLIYPKTPKFIVINITDKVIEIKTLNSNIVFGFHPDNVHDNIFLIYRSGTDIENAELFNIDNQN